MKKQVLYSQPIMICAAFILLLPQMTWAGTIVIGSISLEPGAEIKRFLPLARYLAGQLETEDIDQGKVVVANSIPQMAALLREGKVDLYVDSPFTIVAVSRLSGSKLLLRRWKKGVGEYHATIIAKKDSGLDRPEDLKGKMIAFEDPFSSSGYLLPKMVLLQKGLKLVPYESAFDPVDPEDTGYVFSGSDEAIIVWVLRGKVAAGAMDNYSFLKKAKGKLDHLKIIYRSFSIPRHIVSHRADLSPRLVARIKEILLKMDQSEDGKKALHAFGRTKKFDPIPDQAMDPLLQSMQFINTEFGLQ